MSPTRATSTPPRSTFDLHQWALDSASHGSAASDSYAAIRELNRRHADASPREERVLGGRAALDRLITDDDPDRALLVEKVVDRSALQDKLLTIATTTRRELLSLHAGDPPSEETFVAAMGPDRLLVERGVRLRVVYPVEFAHVSQVRAYTETMQKHGVQFHFADAVPYRMIVSDAARAVVPIVRERRSEGAIITREPALVAGLRHLAHGLFRSGRGLNDIDLAAPSGRPSEIELAVIRVMSQGLTDETAAKRLAVSERTFRRYVTQVMDRLGATGRFQAGMRAVERGWL